MEPDAHPIYKLLKLIEENGARCLLPQNLPDALFCEMVLNANAIDEDNTKRMSTSTLLVAVLHLTSMVKSTDNPEIEILTSQQMEHFSMYITAVRLEWLRREGNIGISYSSLPTLKDIFSKERKVNLGSMYQATD